MRILFILQIVAGTLAACGIGFYLLCIWSARAYLHLRRQPGTFLGAGSPFIPPVSILDMSWIFAFVSLLIVQTLLEQAIPLTLR